MISVWLLACLIIYSKNVNCYCQKILCPFKSLTLKKCPKEHKTVLGLSDVCIWKKMKENKLNFL